MKLRIIFLSLVFYPLFSIAQVAMGGWSSHYAYNQTDKVEQTTSKIFAVADGSLFSVDKDGNSLTTYSKVDGLTDFSISDIKYNETLGVLLIAYEDGNIDLLSSDAIANIPDIKEKTTTASKTPNDIFFNNEYTYISNGIGIVVVNLKKKEVTDTYILGNNSTMVPVKSTTIFGDSIYALTASGMYVGYKGNKLLADYGNWQYRSNLPLTSSNNAKLMLFNSKLYLLKESGAVYSSNDAVNWTLFDNTQSYTGMKISDNNLLLYTSTSVLKYNSSLVQQLSSGIKKCNDVIYNSAQSAYWIASDSTGLVKTKNDSIIERYKPEGPATNKIFTLAYQEGRLFALSGGNWDIQDDSRTGAVMIYENDEWKNITKKNIYPSTKKNFIALTKIAVDKSDKTHFFISSYRDGLYEFKNDSVATRYYSDNSLLTTRFSDDYYGTQPIGFDNNNNLWIAQSESPKLKVLINDGTWVTNQYSELTSPRCNGYDKLLITSNNYKWFNLCRSTQDGGLFVLDDNNNPASVSNHQTKYFSSVTDQDGNSVSINPVYCFAKDSDENVWIGGSNGPIVFKNTSDIFNSDYTVERPKIPRNDGTDYADYLLEGQNIKTIAVDPANRKWIGTTGSGAYLMSSDGITTIKHFTAENSPLPSDVILSIGINNLTGEVFFATDLGLISYKSDATSGGENYASLSIYPNPVRENFTGIITINGLMDNSTIKITDAAGNLIYQTKSNGGIATWNGKNANGKKVSSGVYFVMGANASETNKDNVKTAIGKILIIK